MLELCVTRDDDTDGITLSQDVNLPPNFPASCQLILKHGHTALTWESLCHTFSTPNLRDRTPNAKQTMLCVTRDDETDGITLSQVVNISIYGGGAFRLAPYMVFCNRPKHGLLHVFSSDDFSPRPEPSTPYTPDRSPQTRNLVDTVDIYLRRWRLPVTSPPAQALP